MKPDGTNGNPITATSNPASNVWMFGGRYFGEKWGSKENLLYPTCFKSVLIGLSDAFAFPWPHPTLHSHYTHPYPMVHLVQDLKYAH